MMKITLGQRLRSFFLRRETTTATVGQTCETITSTATVEQTCETTTTIEELPDEVLELVFGYLPLADRKRSRLVCKRWLNVNSSEILTKNDVIVMSEDMNFGGLNIHKSHINLRFTSSSKVNLSDNFWSRHGSFVKSIEIVPEGSSFVALDLLKAIDYCPNIERLALGPWRSPTKSEFFDRCGPLERLTSLEVYTARMKDIFVFANNETNLKRFGLRPFEFGQAFSPTYFTLIEKQAYTLEHLYLPACHLNDQLLNQIVDVLGPQVKGLHIPCWPKPQPGFSWENRTNCPCLGFINHCLPKIANKFPDLEELDLSFHCSLESIESRVRLISALRCLENLKYISLKDTRITDDVFSAIAALEHLQGLDLSLCSCLTTDGVLNAFGQTQHTKLLRLRLSGNKWVTDDLLCRILPQFANLRCLYLDQCSHVTPTALTSVSANWKMLTSLSLRSCYGIINLIEPSQINELKRLKYLNLACLYNLNEVLSALTLPELQVLNLTRLNLIGESFISLLENCPSLQTIFLDKTKEVSVMFVLANLSAKVRKCSYHDSKGNDFREPASVFNDFDFCRVRCSEFNKFYFKIDPPERQEEIFHVGENVIEENISAHSCASFCKCQ